jgi:ornithine cyclodeaminase/alanine dehydrogenase-like protein (mu-crystallin family)
MTTAPPTALPAFDAPAIRAAVAYEHLIEPVARAFADYSQGLGESPVSMFAPAGADGDVHVKSAWLPGSPLFVVKVGSWFRGHGASGLIIAFDAQTGAPLALLHDDHHLSDVRTAAAGALAARLVARADSRTVGVLGTGVQAYLQVLAVAAERPVTSVRTWGRRAEAAQRVVAALRRRLPLSVDVTAVATPRDACSNVDVLITATSSTQPLVEADWLAPGTHIAAVGADDAGKVELAPACIARADLLVVDSRELTAQYGDLAYALSHGIHPASPAIELGELTGKHTRARTTDDQITICKLIGLGVQDLAAAQVTLERLAAAATTPTAPKTQPASALDLSCR